MKYRNLRITLTELLKKNGYVDSEVELGGDSIFEKQFSEWCKIVIYFYKSNLEERAYMFCEVYFPNIEVEEKYRGLRLFEGVLHRYMFENYTRDDIEKIILDVKVYDKMFESEDALKKAVAKNKKILDFCDIELVEFLGYKKIRIPKLMTFYVKQRSWD